MGIVVVGTEDDTRITDTNSDEYDYVDNDDDDDKKERAEDIIDFYYNMKKLLLQGSTMTQQHSPIFSDNTYIIEDVGENKEKLLKSNPIPIPNIFSPTDTQSKTNIFTIKLK